MLEVSYYLLWVLLSKPTKGNSMILQGKQTHRPKVLNGSKYSKLNLNTDGSFKEKATSFTCADEQTGHLPGKYWSYIPIS